MYHCEGQIPKIDLQVAVARDESEGTVKDKRILSVFLAPLFLPERFEDQDSGNLTLNHPPVEMLSEDHSTNHRFGPNIDHDSSMRTSRPVRDARAPNQSCGLTCADQGHPRAAFDANDLRICHVGAGPAFPSADVSNLTLRL
jgi:hypothetical protein